MFEASPLHKLKMAAIYDPEQMLGSEQLYAYPGNFSIPVACLYLQSFLMNYKPVERAIYFNAPGFEKFVEPLGIVDGIFSVESLTKSIESLREFCASTVDYSSLERYPKTEELLTEIGGSRTDMALSLSMFPGQALILMGENPINVFNVIKSRAAIVLRTPYATEADVDQESTAIANNVFLPFPELWSTMGISPENYLGLRFDQIDPSKRHAIHQTGLMYGQHTKMEPASILTVVAENIACFGFNFGDDFFLRPSAIPDVHLRDDQFLRLVESLIASDSFSYSPLLLNLPQLERVDRERLCALMVKAVANPDSDTRTLLTLISQHNPKSFDHAYEKIIESNQGDSAVELLLEHQPIPKHLFGKVSRRIRGKMIESELGL